MGADERRSTNPARALELIHSALLNGLPGVSEENCYLAEAANECPQSASEYVYQIVPSWPSIDYANFVGGGRRLIELQLLVTVAVWRLGDYGDEPQRAGNAFLDRQIGCWSAVRNVLNALVDNDLTESDGYARAADGGIAPSAVPRFERGAGEHGQWWRVEVDFTLTIVWDLDDTA